MLGLVVYNLTNAVKYARARKWGALLTIALAWLVGFLAALLIGATRWAGEIRVGDADSGASLDALNVAELIVVGFVVASFAGVIDKWIVSRDNTQTAAVPSLSEKPLTAIPQRTMGQSVPDLSTYTFEDNAAPGT